MVYLTRRVEFSAAHTLYNPQLSPEENRECFGKCGNRAVAVGCRGDGERSGLRDGVDG